MIRPSCERAQGQELTESRLTISGDENQDLSPLRRYNKCNIRYVFVNTHDYRFHKKKQKTIHWHNLYTFDKITTLNEFRYFNFYFCFTIIFILGQLRFANFHSFIKKIQKRKLNRAIFDAEQFITIGFSVQVGKRANLFSLIL